MSVSLYDGEAYIVDSRNIDRNWALSFFLDGHMEDYLLLYDEDDQYGGLITYKRLLRNTDLETAVIHEKLFFEGNFWNDARALLGNGKKIDAVPVFDQNMEIVYFAKYDEELVDAWSKMYDLRAHVDKEMWKDFRCFTNHFHIRGINDVLFWLREWLVSLGVKVSVEGEAWSFFGIESTEGIDEKAIVVDKKCKWLDSVYIEHLDWLEQHYGAVLREVLCRPYMPEKKENRGKVIFYLANYPHFVESISPLIFRYLQSGKECICAFPSIRSIVAEGDRNIVNMIKVVGKLKAAGAKCHLADDEGLLYNRYELCFLLSEYSGRLPMRLRQLSRCVIALQSTAIYTHMYLTEGRFEEVFSEQAREETDYLVVSDYIADWICERDRAWGEKVLRLGYPKLDTLYHALKRKCDIPDNWIDRVSGKKVYLFTTNSMEQSWLEFFADREDDKIAIWRPHPLNLEGIWVKRLEEISEKYNIIIDKMPSYYAAFQLSDALISAVHSSITINYLYTGKPICLYDESWVYKSAVIDYRKEYWYKSACNARDEETVLEFIRTNQRGETTINERQALYREYVTSNFDGNVCNRIYDYFEKSIRH